MNAQLAPTPTRAFKRWTRRCRQAIWDASCASSFRRCQCRGGWRIAMTALRGCVSGLLGSHAYVNSQLKLAAVAEVWHPLFELQELSDVPKRSGPPRAHTPGRRLRVQGHLHCVRSRR